MLPRARALSTSASAMFKPWIPPVQHVAQAQAAYGRDGYVLLDDVFTPEEARQLEQIIDEVSDPASEVASKVWHYEWVNYETEDRRRVLGRCEDFVHHPGWSELVDHKLLPIATALLGEPATLAKEKIHPKHPGAAGFRAHQDAAAYSVRERKENGVGGVVEDIWTDSSGDAGAPTRTPPPTARPRWLPASPPSSCSPALLRASLTARRRRRSIGSRARRSRRK